MNLEYALSEIRVERVTTAAELKRFIRFPWKVYAGDPNWAPPLITDVKAKLNVRKNPFFEHAERELFLARRSGEITGRVLGIVDRNHNDFHNEKVVFYGMYESLNDPETAAALLDAVAVWGKERGMDTLRGTVNLSLNDECAFLAEGFDSPPAVMMPYHPRYYLDLMEACGQVKARDLYAFLMTRDYETDAKVKAVVQRIQVATTVTCRPIRLKDWKEEADRIISIYNHAWEKNWGFVPWTGNEMKHMVKSLKSIADPDLVIIAEDKGRPVGFGFGLPNYNEILTKMNGRLFPFGLFKFLLGRKKIKSMRMLVFGILKEYRASGISYLLATEMVKQGMRKGFQWAELSWTLEDNEAVNKFAASLGGRVYKKYRIYEKRIG